MSSSWGNTIKISIFGESHGAAIGVVLDGLPAGIPIDMEDLLSFMDRRRPGKALFATSRKESDTPHILSGYYHGQTTGTPLAIVIQNADTHSTDYKEMEHIARPAHADFTGHLRYRGAQDPRGGGHFSGRLTAPFGCSRRDRPANSSAKRDRYRRAYRLGRRAARSSFLTRLGYMPRLFSLPEKKFFQCWTT